jgi:NAD(P)-dependent dehydrogenase (short-subunit alcohol dehydrogenase family)
VVLACDNTQKADAAANKLRAEVSGAQVRVVQLNLASLRSVKQCAELLNNTEDKVHLLINNAGKVSGKEMTILKYVIIIII